MSSVDPPSPSAADALAGPLEPSGFRSAFLAAASVTVASLTGRFISAAPVRGWYRTIHKPSFNPPNWAFPVAWTTLFILMAIAFYRVLRRPASTVGRTRSIALYATQLAFNIGWSAAFFGARSPLAGLIVVVPFLLLIVATGVAFYRIDRAAGWLLVPYAAWVSFATVLNATIVAMN